MQSEFGELAMIKITSVAKLSFLITGICASLVIFSNAHAREIKFTVKGEVNFATDPNLPPGMSQNSSIKTGYIKIEYILDTATPNIGTTTSGRYNVSSGRILFGEDATSLREIAHVGPMTRRSPYKIGFIDILDNSQVGPSFVFDGLVFYADLAGATGVPPLSSRTTFETMHLMLGYNPRTLTDTDLPLQETAELPFFSALNFFFQKGGIAGGMIIPLDDQVLTIEYVR